MLINKTSEPLSILEIFRIFLILGCVAFGGPTAHLGYFQRMLVDQRRWLTQSEYTQLIALCQIIPGPTSSQVGMALGYWRGGWWGSLAAWVGFTLPSAVIMAGLAMGLQRGVQLQENGLQHGLHLAACAVVLLAIWQMARPVQQDWRAMAIAIVTGVLAATTLLGQWHIVLILLAGVAGLLFYSGRQFQPINLRLGYPRWIAWGCLLGFAGLLVLAILWSASGQPTGFLATFYQASSLVFGGGHVVLPLLQQHLTHYPITESQFLTGYGLIQAMPGPLFNIAAYLGATAYPDQPVVMALLAVVAIFLPAALILFAVLRAAPLLQRYPRLRQGLQGVNAAVIGLLAAAVLPLLIHTIQDWQDVLIIGLAIMVLYLNRLPVVIVVVLCALYGWLA